jgi:hypothetical protein
MTSLHTIGKGLELIIEVERKNAYNDKEKNGGYS